MSVDLEPATTRVADLVRAIPEDVLDGPTPCAGTSVGALLDHISGLSVAFTAAAAKVGGEGAPSADASRLGDDWRSRIPQELAALAEAWSDPSAWDGTTRAGGLEMPGEVAGVVALDEVVLHGWDLARASGQPYDCEPELLEAVHGFVQQFSGPGKESEREGLFGPEVAVADDAPLLDRVLGLSGRDPGWSPS